MAMDGRIMLSGFEWSGDQDMLVARLMPDGSLDPTWVGEDLDTGGPGLFSFHGITGNAEQATGIALAPDGNVLLAGLTGDAAMTHSDVYVAKLRMSDGKFAERIDVAPAPGRSQAVATNPCS